MTKKPFRSHYLMKNVTQLDMLLSKFGKGTWPWCILVYKTVEKQSWKTVSQSWLQASLVKIKNGGGGIHTHRIQVLSWLVMSMYDGRLCCSGCRQKMDVGLVLQVHGSFSCNLDYQQRSCKL